MTNWTAISIQEFGSSKTIWQLLFWATFQQQTKSKIKQENQNTPPQSFKVTTLIAVVKLWTNCWTFKNPSHVVEFPWNFVMDCFVDVVIDCKWITVEKKRKGWDPAVNVLVKIRGACFRFIFTITIIEYWENQVRGVQRKFTYKPPLTLTYTTLFTTLTFATLPWFWPQKPAMDTCGVAQHGAWHATWGVWFQGLRLVMYTKSNGKLMGETRNDLSTVWSMAIGSTRNVGERNQRSNPNMCFLSELITTFSHPKIKDKHKFQN